MGSNITAMKILAWTMLIVFVMMALFSFGVIDAPLSDGGMASCLATKIHNGACPPESFSFDAAVFHASAFGAFSVAVLASLAVLALLALARLFASAVFPLLVSSRISRAVLAIVPLDCKSFREKQRALARLEHSPTR